MFQIKLFTFNPIQENTYVLYNENGHCLVIDPGCYFDDEKDELHSFIKSQNLKPTYLLNTHCHLDHVFGNKFIAEAFNIKLNAHRKEEAVLQMAPASGLMFNLPFDSYTGPIDFIEEGDIILLDADQLEALHVPGHSPGSLCYYCKKQKFVIGGDTLFLNSIGRTDLPGGSHHDLVSHIKEKLFSLPDDVIVYPGHGPQTTIGAEKKNNPFLQDR